MERVPVGMFEYRIVTSEGAQVGYACMRGAWAVPVLGVVAVAWAPGAASSTG